MSEKIKIICVVGPTASGKSEIGVNIAKAVGGEIISADSMQIYKGMHIASAAADTAEMGGIKHHLLEFLPYGSTYTVCDWVTAARKTIAEISAKGKVPVIVGGTGLYINSLVDNIEFVSTKTDFSLRRSLEETAAKIGGKGMLRLLSELDPKAAENLHENDIKRIIRAIEINKQSGLTKEEQNRVSKSGENPYAATVLGINFKDREKLYERINARVDKMLSRGLLEEARAAYALKSDKTNGAVQAIGHKEFFDFFEGGETLFAATEKLKQSTRRYAKRQITWFGARQDIEWIYRDCESTEERINEILKREGFI